MTTGTGSENARVMWSVISIAIMVLLVGDTVPSLGQQAGSYRPRTVSDGGVIVGQVTFSDPVPAPRRLEITQDGEVCDQEPKFAEDLVVGEDGGLLNVVVWLSDVREGKPWDTTSPPALDQRGCRFTPHVLIVQAGETFEVRNSDGILHNVHTRGTENRPVNKAQPGFLTSVRVRLPLPEIVHVRCDAHDWMSGWITVAAHPYYAITDGNGNFQLDNVPPGSYTLELWHEQLGSQTQQVTVTTGSDTRVQARFASN